MLQQQDFQQLKEKGISPEEISRQIENFKKGFPFVKLVAPATKGHGIKVFDDTETHELAVFFDENGPKHSLIKFVPASGAASRMFKHLFEFMESFKGTAEDLKKLESDKSFNSVYYFIENIKKFAFIDDLNKTLGKDGLSLDNLLETRNYGVLVEYILTDKGLGYASLPKGLLQFHQYNVFSRLSVEEHLVEGAHYARDNQGNVKIHFTVSPEHREKFLATILTVKPHYEKLFGVKFQIGFSEQKSSTDTVAVILENEPFRESDGKLLFRPAGHGALIENLNDLKGDIVFVKNIDNIVPDRLKEPTHLYKKVIGGLLLKLKQLTDQYLHLLEKGGLNDARIDEIAGFAQNELLLDLGKNFGKAPVTEKAQILFDKLNRPIRICGMVKNEGEPGGGPFWLENSKGEVSLQIVESSQIDLKDPGQKNIVQESTHFNPVDLVCSVLDYKSRQFDLRKYVDPETGFISEKSSGGKKLKAQELPGLWNGAMADWITIFVETPIITFNPVKTINDLLREQHQNG
jgi:hypothetical protein